MSCYIYFVVWWYGVPLFLGHEKRTGSYGEVGLIPMGRLKGLNIHATRGVIIAGRPWYQVVDLHWRQSWGEKISL